MKENFEISKERIQEVLPENIQNSDVINEKAKKILAVLLDTQFTHPKAIECGFVVMSNTVLASMSGFRGNTKAMLSSLQELIDHQLVHRTAGQKWSANSEPTASVYYIDWDNLEKPLKRLKFSDLKERFKSLKKPISTTYTNTISDI